RAQRLVAVGGFALARRDERDRVGRARRGQFDPAAVVAIGEVDALLEPKRVEVELQRSVLVDHRYEHGADLVDADRGCCVGHAAILSCDCGSALSCASGSAPSSPMGSPSAVMVERGRSAGRNRAMATIALAAAKIAAASTLR